MTHSIQEGDTVRVIDTDTVFTVRAIAPRELLPGMRRPKFEMPYAYGLADGQMFAYPISDVEPVDPTDHA